MIINCLQKYEKNLSKKRFYHSLTLERITNGKMKRLTVLEAVDIEEA